MSFADLLNATLVIKRMAVGNPVVLDEYGQPTVGETTVATVAGRIRPRTAREVPAPSQAGVAVSTHIGDIYPLAGLDTACWIESGGLRYDLTGINDAAGAGHHLTLDLVAVR